MPINANGVNVGQWFLCRDVDSVALTAPDAKLNTGKKFFEKNANLSPRQINQLYSMFGCELVSATSWIL